ARLELVLLEAQRGAGPVRGGAADGLADPGRQVGEVVRDAPAAGGRALVEPRELPEGLPLVLDEGRGRLPRTRFEHDDLDALLAQLVRQRASAGAGADDHDEAVVVQVELRHLSLLPTLAASAWMRLSPGRAGGSPRPRARGATSGPGSRA